MFDLFVNDQLNKQVRTGIDPESRCFRLREHNGLMNYLG